MIENPADVITAEIEKIEKQKKKLVELYYADGITKEDFKVLNDEHNVQIESFRRKVKEFEKTEDKSATLQKVYLQAENILDNFVNKLEFSDEMAKQFLNKIVAHGFPDDCNFRRNGLRKFRNGL
ncbi:hypothetical protein FACS1894219_09760 [Clostridia bacterium]|nr:hypothetical protein FACS1894219_09760 [Clostridia bacterium]